MASLFHISRPEEGLQVVQHDLEALQPGLETHSRSVSSVTSFDKEKTAKVWPVQPRHSLQDQQRRIFGLRVTTICLLLALLGAIIAAVLAGVLVSKAHCNAATTTSDASAGTKTTTITTSASPTATPSSGCSSQAGQDWISPLSHLKYTRACNTYLDSSNQQYQNLFTAYQSSLDTCVAMCDSYNYWSESTNVTVAVWNWKGEGNQTPGICWCVQVDGNYTMASTEGQDSALRVGSYGEGAIPS